MRRARQRVARLSASICRRRCSTSPAARAEGVTNASLLQADAQIHPFEPAAFDAAISRTGAMFFGDQPAAFDNIGRSLVPGGRMILVTWQGLAANEWVREITTALA